MSATQTSLSYVISGSVQVMTAGGSQCNGAINLAILAGTDVTDGEVSAIQQAIVAAFPTAWGVTNDYISVAKQADVLTQYTTDYTATPPSFS